MSDRISAERAIEVLRALLDQTEGQDGAARPPVQLALPSAGPAAGGSAKTSLDLLTRRFGATEPEIVERARELQALIGDPSTTDNDRSVAHGQLRGICRIPGRTPWTCPEVEEVRRRLDTLVYGLPGPKDLLARSAGLAVLAARQGTDAPAPTVLLVGPPGTGKTRLGQGIADALDLPFRCVPLAGQGAMELAGQHPVWEGAGIGALLMAMIRAATRRFVLLLDEIDKLSRSHHGSAESALLGLLDDRRILHDTYLDLDVDTSQVLVVATANDLDAVPAPLRNRFEVIHVEAYSPDEIASMVQRWIFPEVARAYGITSVKVDRAAAELVAAASSGARDAKRHCAALLAEAAKDWKRVRRAVRITEDVARRALGPGQPVPADHAASGRTPGRAPGPSRRQQFLDLTYV